MCRYIYRSMRWQKLRKELHFGRHAHLRLRILKLLATLYICSGIANAITCRCFKNERCSQLDGSCPNGCEPGWHGPGCQIGNLAFRKPAYQSSTYGMFSADYAVNGVIPPPGDYSESNCSHTVESRENPHWWFVSLSETEDFVLTDITIVNRQGPKAQALRNFYILYTSETTGLPNLTSWKNCIYHPTHQNVTVTTHTCSSGTAIGRRVAVYLGINPQSSDILQLALCEVTVNGYAYQETAMFHSTSMSVTSNCDNITVKLGALPVVPPTFLVVYMNTIKGTQGSRAARIRNDGTRSVTLQALSNVLYEISVAPETCCIGSMCLNDQATSIESPQCVVGPRTISVSTGIPQYQKCSVDDSLKSLEPFQFSTTMVCVFAIVTGYIVAVIIAVLLTWRTYKSSIQNNAVRSKITLQTEVVRMGERAEESAYLSLDQNTRLQDENIYCNLKNTA